MTHHDAAEFVDDPASELLWNGVRRLLDNLRALAGEQPQQLVAALRASRDWSMNAGNLDLAGLYDALVAITEQFERIEGEARD